MPRVFAEGKALTAGLLAWPLKRAFKRAGLREIGWHVLRHTFASHLAMRGVPLKVIQELLGHASIATTMIYAHLAPHVARDAVRLLDRARPPVGTPNAAPATAPSYASKRAPKRAPNSARVSASARPMPAPLAKDRRNPPDAPVTN